MGSGNKGLYSGASIPDSHSDDSALISKPGDVRYSKKKTEGYLLNPGHPAGGPKAKFMHDVLGYSQGDGQIFHKHVIDAIKGKQPDKTETSRYGIKHTFHTTLTGKDGKTVSANVVIVIQKDNGRKTYKIVTVYPDKKEKS